MQRPPGVAKRLVIKGRHAVRNGVSSLREKIASRRPALELDQVQRRLELLLAAMYGRHISVSALHTKKRHWVVRVARSLSRDPESRESMPELSEDAILLPGVLSAREGISSAVARFRLLAVEQAERLTRGTATQAPHADALERDLYLLREGAAIDAKIARVLPRMHDALANERRAALAKRPRLDALTPQEREVERLLRHVLESSPDAGELASTAPADSLVWAKDMAAQVRRERGRYRGLPPAQLWGAMPRPADTNEAANDSTKDAGVARQKPLMSANSVGGSQGVDSEDGKQRIADGKSKDSTDDSKSRDEPGDSTEPTPNEGENQDDATQFVQHKDAPQTPSETRGATRITGTPTTDRETASDPGIPYDEWDADARRYRRRAAIVRLGEAAEGDDALGLDVLKQHAALVRQIRHRFERLRARRVLLGRQRAGNELDITACVDGIIDRRVGRTPDDRLYLDARPARRGFAISLLVDVSGSTETRVSGHLKIIDLERVALLLASEALDALGDLYSITAFTGKGPSKVMLTTVKGFDEQNGETTRRRIAALKARGFTRLGTAVRHETRQLARQTAGHRLLLIISDGRPNDIDEYQGTYGIEDARQAIMEARASGVFPFCLTVDRDASEYLPRIFGTAGHTVLRRPEQLPSALLSAVTTLVRRPS